LKKKTRNFEGTLAAHTEIIENPENEQHQIRFNKKRQKFLS